MANILSSNSIPKNGTSGEVVCTCFDAILQMKYEYSSLTRPFRDSEIDHYKLPESSFLGFSAATGQVSDNHEIISVNTHTIVHKPKEHNNTQARGKGRGRSNRGPGLLHRFFSSLFGWIWFTIKLVLLAGAMGGGAYYGLKLKQRKNVKRF